MKKERLNYKECREIIFKLLEKSNTLSKQEIWKAIGLGTNMDYLYDHWRFPQFLKHTRHYAFREYFKAKKERVPTSNIITLKFILSREQGTPREFLQFCEIERIPFLYYIHQIKKYVFPNEQLYSPILNRRLLIMLKGIYNHLKGMEIWQGWTSTDDIIKYYNNLSKKFNKDNEGFLLLLALIRKDYKCGETREQMFKRLKFEEGLKKLNEEIEKNLYTIADLELWKE